MKHTLRKRGGVKVATTKDGKIVPTCDEMGIVRALFGRFDGVTRCEV